MGLMPLRNAIILTDAGSGVNTFFRGGEIFSGGGRYARPRKPAGPGIALAAIGADPLSAPASKLARGREIRANPLGFTAPPDTKARLRRDTKGPLRGPHEMGPYTEKLCFV